MQNLPTLNTLTTCPSVTAPLGRRRDDPTALMMLTSRAKSAVAVAAIDTLAAQIIVLNGNRKVASKEYRLALGAMVAELIRAASHDPIRACFRPLAAASFSDLGIGYQPFTRALTDMEHHGFARIDKGQSAYGDRAGTVTRIHVTPRLTNYLADAGITVADRWKHFDYRRAADDVAPIQLRAKSIRRGHSNTPGRKMKVDYNLPSVQSYAAQIRKLNVLYVKQQFIGPNGEEMDIALHRGFNLGDETGHGYQKGGRAYAGYQSISSNDRDKIIINGQATKEVDISACFLTIAHFLLKKTFSNNVDPYVGPDYHRDIVKAWVNLTIGYSAYHTRWPAETIKKLAEKGHIDVRKYFPITKVRDDVHAHIPIVKEWVDSAFTWADLFFVESQIILDATECLAFDHGVVGIPIHDGIRVPTKSMALARAVINDSFFKHTGIRPIVNSNSSLL